MTETSAPSRTSSAAAPSVLDYAQQRPQDPIIRRLRALALALGCVLMCAAAGWLFDPQIYRAIGFLVVDPTQISPAAQEVILDTNQVQAKQAAMVAGVAGNANIQTILSQLPPTMNLTAAQIKANLKVRVVPQSRLVAVSFDHDDPRVAAAVVNVAMGRYVAPGVNVAAVATPPAQPQHNRLYPLAGAAVGLLIGTFIVARRGK